MLLVWLRREIPPEESGKGKTHELNSTSHLCVYEMSISFSSSS